MTGGSGLSPLPLACLRFGPTASCATTQSNPQRSGWTTGAGSTTLTNRDWDAVPNWLAVVNMAGFVAAVGLLVAGCVLCLERPRHRPQSNRRWITDCGPHSGAGVGVPDRGGDRADHFQNDRVRREVQKPTRGSQPGNFQPQGGRRRRPGRRAWTIALDPEDEFHCPN